MYTIFGNSNVELCKEVGKIDTPKIAKNRLLKKTFLSRRIFYGLEKPRCQTLSLCIFFQNRKVFLQLNKRPSFNVQ